MKKCMRAKTVGVAALLLAASIGVSGGPAAATPGVFDPSLGLMAEPILTTAAGETIPVDSAGLGGSMFVALPQDSMSAHEQGIVDDTLTALNYERSLRGLFPLVESPNITSVVHRFVKSAASDADDYPQCPVVISSPLVRSCEPAAPGLEWHDFLNPSNGPTMTLGAEGGGATIGVSTETGGGFVAGLIAAGGNHRADVLGLDGRFAGVGVACQPDGRTYFVWEVADYDPAYRLASPASYTGTDLSPHVPTNFGRRCRQPGAAWSVTAGSSGAATVVLSSSPALLPGRLLPTGPLLDGVRKMHVEFRNSSGVLVHTANAPFADFFDYLPYTTPVLPDGDFTVTMWQFNDYERTLSTTKTVTIGSPTTTTTVPGGGGSSPSMVSVTPARIVESRVGPTERTVDGRFQGFGRLSARTTVPVQVTGRAGVPAGATTAALNLTAVSPAGSGFVVAYPCGGALPLVSNVNFTAGRVVANSAIVKLDGSGRVCFWSSKATDLVVDINAYVPAGGTPIPVTPARIVESRVGPTERTVDGRFQGFGRLSARTTVPVQVTGRAGVPAGATTAALNLTAVSPAGSGFVVAYPCGGALPLVSNVNFTAGQVVANSAIVKLDGAGRVCFWSSKATDLVVDINAYVPAGGTPIPVTPARIVESRVGPTERTVDGRFQGFGRLSARTTVPVQVTGRAGVPAGATTAALNLTAVSPAGSGFVVAYPCGGALPLVSNVNFTAGQVVANSAIVKLDGAGRVCFWSSKATDLVVDINAYVAAS